MKIILLFLLLIEIFTIRIKREKPEGKKTKGDNIGTNLYSSMVVTKAMKRPNYWYINAMLPKPNEKFFEEAEYNGLRYQTEQLQDNLEREYNGYVRDFYDENLAVSEQNLIAGNK